MKPTPAPVSIPMVAAVLTAFAAFYLSTFSPFVLMLPVLFVASLLLPSRFEREASSIWGVRLLVYASLAILGRAPTGAPGYFVDAQAFTTAGLIAGGELILQAFRKPPAGARFDPWIVSLSGVIFLIACNSFRAHVVVLAPLYMLFLLLSLVDLRPRASSKGTFSGVRRALTILVAVTLGAGLHQSLWAYRGSIMALGARILSGQNLSAQSSQGAGVTDNPQLSSSLGGNLSTARLTAPGAQRFPRDFRLTARFPPRFPSKPVRKFASALIGRAAKPTPKSRFCAKAILSFLRRSTRGPSCLKSANHSTGTGFKAHLSLKSRHPSVTTSSTPKARPNTSLKPSKARFAWLQTQRSDRF
jgi:hypothetical protein